VAYLPGFKSDLFISYRRSSNEGPDRWVSSFQQALELSLGDSPQSGAMRSSSTPATTGAASWSTCWKTRPSAWHSCRAPTSILVSAHLSALAQRRTRTAHET
jgi:hypothetical protein